MIGPVGQELQFIANIAPKESRLKRFRTSVSTPTTPEDAAKKFNQYRERFHSVSEGEGFNSALYGFVKDATRYYISIGLPEEEAFDRVVSDVQEHPAYNVWGQLDSADEVTIESGFDACLNEDDFWEMQPAEEIWRPAARRDKNETHVPMHLWENKMSFGAVGLLVGDGGVGKSTALMKIAAKLSHGTLPGHFLGQKGMTLFYSMEDDFNSIFVPRLQASGGDPDYIEFMEEPLKFPTDIEILRKTINYYQERENMPVRLIVFDPLEAYMQQGARTNETKEVGDMLTSLNKLASEEKCTILGIKHFSKMQDVSLTHKVSGSMAYINQSRFVLAAIQTDTYEDDRRCAIGVFKGNNISPLSPSAYYEIVPTTFTASGGDLAGCQGVTAYAKFLGEGDNINSEDIRRNIKVKKEREGKKEEADNSKKNQGQLWLTSLLNRRGPMRFSEVKEERERFASAPSQSTMERILREHKNSSPMHFKNDKYMLPYQWVAETIELDGQLPDGTPLPGLYNGVDRVKPNDAAIKLMEQYKLRERDNLLDAYLENING